MKKSLLVLLLFVAAYGFGQTLADRVKHNDPSTYRELSAVHAGAGKMGFTQVIGRNDLSTNFLYLHTGSIDKKSGIGHHFHHTIEEMYVLLSGEAEFTINGRTSRIKAPAVVPCKKGDAHAIYNHTNEKVKWMNFAVSSTKGRGDNFDLNDTRVGAVLDPVPAFVNATLDKKLLKNNANAYSGEGSLYRRLFQPEVFGTDWNHVDHAVIPAGSASKHTLTGVEEVFYVLKGEGKIKVNGQEAAFKADDAFFGKIGEQFEIEAGSEVELLVVGIAPAKNKLRAIEKPLIQPKAMVLQMDFVVDKANAEAFEKMYYSIYVPAMTVQKGYLESKVLRMFPESVSKEIQAEPTTYNYQVQISFATEADRRNWVASPEHQIAWPAATALAKEYKWRGYDVMGDDYTDRK